MPSTVVQPPLPQERYDQLVAGLAADRKAADDLRAEAQEAHTKAAEELQRAEAKVRVVMTAPSRLVRHGG